MTAKRELLLETATRLFAKNGYHAVGVDRIIAEAGVSKVTMYRYFRSKDELILAVLRRRDETYRNALMRDVTRRARGPRERLLALFDSLEDWLTEDGFTGCLFIKAAGEFPLPDDPVHAAATEHKRLMMQFLGKLTTAAGASDPESLAQQIYLLIDGAIVHAHTSGAGRRIARGARQAAEILIHHAIAPDART